MNFSIGKVGGRWLIRVKKHCGPPKKILAFTVTIIIGDVKIISGVQVITIDQGTPFI